jgi:hypothetical protein
LEKCIHIFPCGHQCLLLCSATPKEHNHLICSSCTSEMTKYKIYFQILANSPSCKKNCSFCESQMFAWDLTTFKMFDQLSS